MTRAAFLFVLLPLTLTCAVGIVLADADELTYQTFDVSDLLWPRLSTRGPRIGSLAPGQRARGEAELPEGEAVADANTLTDLIRARVEPESWEAEGTSLAIRAGALHLKNRPEVVRGVGAFLYELAAHAQARALFSIRVVEGGLDTYPDTAAETLLRESATLEVPFGVARFVAVTNRIRYVADYEVEIAQGSNISDPVVVPAAEGLVVDLVAHPTIQGNGVLLDAVVRTGRYGPARRLELGVDEEYFAEPFRSEERKHLGVLELPEFHHVNARVTSVVASGGTVEIPVVHGGRLVTVLLTAERLGPTPTDRVLDVGALTAESLPVRFGVDVEDDSRPLLAPRVRFREAYALRSFPSIDGAEELVMRSLGSLDPDQAGAWVEALGRHRLFVHGAEDVQKEVRAFFAARERETIRPIALDLRVYSVAAPVPAGPGKRVEAEGARLVAGGRLQTLAGRTTSLLAGSTVNYLADYDVEVAQEARIADPTIGQSFDGLLANLSPRLSGDGRTVAVDLDLQHTRHVRATEPYDTGTQFLGPIDRMQVKRFAIRTTVRVPSGGTYVLDAGPDPGDESRRLAVELGVQP